jgi:ribose 5-phosphate isomerase B
MKPTVYFATDHAGFALKQVLLAYVQDELGYAVVDCGAKHFDQDDDYPDFISLAAKRVSERPADRAIIIGASGQGEAIVANRFTNVRAVVFYGMPPAAQVDASGSTLDLIASSRLHNDANVLSLGARFITEDEARAAVANWLGTNFSADERHIRRIKKIEQLLR